MSTGLKPHNMKKIELEMRQLDKTQLLEGNEFIYSPFPPNLLTIGINYNLEHLSNYENAILNVFPRKIGGIAKFEQVANFDIPVVNFGVPDKASVLYEKSEGKLFKIYELLTPESNTLNFVLVEKNADINGLELQLTYNPRTTGIVRGHTLVHYNGDNISKEDLKNVDTISAGINLAKNNLHHSFTEYHDRLETMLLFSAMNKKHMEDRAKK